jgi:hypothetical protein
VHCRSEEHGQLCPELDHQDRRLVRAP